MLMYQAIARYKGTDRWNVVTNVYMPFAGEKGIMEYLIEKMKEKYPTIEYKLIEAK